MSALQLRGGTYFTPHRTWAPLTELNAAAGIFTSHVASSPNTPTHVLNTAGFWVTPGFVDAHTHIAWSDFNAADRAEKPAELRHLEAARNAQRTLASGVTYARDAGGASAILARSLTENIIPGPRLQASIRMLGVEQRGDEAGLLAAVDQVIAQGAQWIKLTGTSGMAAPDSLELEPLFSRETLRKIMVKAQQAKARVMVHTWGGDSLTWAIQEGAHSIEHGIFLTDDQAELMAERGTVFVPTVQIYREVHQLAQSGELAPILATRAAPLVAAHPLAVQRALAAGTPIAAGSDYGTAAQHGQNLREIAALMDCGLSAQQALAAGTSVAAALLDGEAAGPRSGQLAPGFVADAVIFDADPTLPETLTNPQHIAAVLRQGVLAYQRPNVALEFSLAQ